MEKVWEDSKPLSTINTMGVWAPGLWVLVGQCLLCRSVFINGKRVKNLHVETKEYCDHTFPRD
jgi:hypothetical protein